MHLIYAVIAVMLLGTFSMNMYRSIRHAEMKMILNEFVTELTGVGYDVLEFAGRMPFDEATDESKQAPLSFPVITSEAELTGVASFGGCAALEYVPGDCDDIDDFEGLVTTVTASDLEYGVSVAVRYVDPNSPDQGGVGKTFAKEVRVSVSNPYLKVGDQVLQVTLTRVFTYNRHIVASSPT